ncbi:hypothetical protein HJC23_000081 [Cyclotella cryptica]|uniref:Sulfotransferase domain-containing protein n=1 Tax=Cyclotella cryptica TaxID=29204 RepID=A0ABD3PIP0_9STRA
MISQAFDPPNEPDPTRKHEYFSSDIPVLLHKHMFRHFLLNETELDVISARTDILWLFAVRSPCEWAEAMKRIPWHMCHPDNIKGCPTIKFIGFERKALMKNYTLEEFFQMPWGDWPESRNFRNLSFVSHEYTYRNVFQLRRHKLMLMKQIMEAVPRNVKIVRLHELERSPEIFIQNLVQEFNLQLKIGYNVQHPSPRIHTEKCLTRPEWRIAQREIDWKLEGEFGYTSFDCHMCY